MQPLIFIIVRAGHGLILIAVGMTFLNFTWNHYLHNLLSVKPIEIVDPLSRVPFLARAIPDSSYTYTRGLGFLSPWSYDNLPEWKNVVWRGSTLRLVTSVAKYSIANTLGVFFLVGGFVMIATTIFYWPLRLLYANRRGPFEPMSAEEF